MKTFSQPKILDMKPLFNNKEHFVVDYTLYKDRIYLNLSEIQEPTIEDQLGVLIDFREIFSQEQIEDRHPEDNALEAIKMSNEVGVLVFDFTTEKQKG